MQPPPPCPPRSACFCEQHPNNPKCTPALPINENVFILFIVGVMLMFLKTKKP